MKKQKKIVALLLALALVVGLLAGCGQSGGSELVGQWTAEMDLSETMNQAIAGAGDMGVDFTAEGWVVQLDFTFNEDGTMEMAVNEASAATLGEKMKEDLTDAVTASLEKVAEEEGTTLDEVLEQSGLDLDSLLDEIGIDPTELLGELDLSYSGKYAVKGDRLYTADSGEPSENNGDCLLYEVKDGEVHLDVTPEDDSEEWDGLLPLVLKKKG